MSKLYLALFAASFACVSSMAMADDLGVGTSHGNDSTVGNPATGNAPEGTTQPISKKPGHSHYGKNKNSGSASNKSGSSSTDTSSEHDSDNTMDNSGYATGRNAR